MNANKKSFQKKFRYHHGDLRACLISVGLDILENQGIDALSLRAVARGADVSQAAPYSHFQDKQALMAAIAEAGFQKLARQMAEAATGITNTGTRIKKLVSTYIHFATSNESLFRLMFGRELSDMKKHPTLAMTAGKSYALISSALAARQSQTVETPFLTVAVWSLCHGLTGLVIDKKINPGTFGTDTIDDFIEKTVAVFDAHLE